MKKKLLKGIIPLLLILITVISINIHSAALGMPSTPYTENVVMSFQDILNDINERVGSDMQAVPPIRRGALQAYEIFFSGQELLDVIAFHEALAIETLENTAIAERQWYEASGIPIEDVVWLPFGTVVFASSVMPRTP